MKTFKSPLPGASPIYFGEDARTLLLGEVEALAPDRVFIVTDRTVEALWAEEILEQLPSAIKAEPVVFNEGDDNKHLGTLQHILGDLLRAGVTERSLLLNVGGGVALNLGGLAASLVGRGLRFAHVATTASAQWQAVASNRQAMHFMSFRNALGVYAPAQFSICDPFFLDSEPPRQIQSGLVDLARLGLVAGGEAYDAALGLLSGPSRASLPGLAATLEGALALRLRFSANDPEERKIDAVESYGRDIGRALYSLAEGRLLMGEARLYGMRAAGELARAAGVMNSAEHARHERLLDAAPVAAEFPRHIRAENLVYKLHGNDKTDAAPVKVMLLEAPGRPAADSPDSRVAVSDDALADAIEKARAHAVL